MKKTAKQMFEELGWECEIRKECIEYKHKTELNNNWVRYSSIRFLNLYQTIKLNEHEYHNIWGAGNIEPEINVKTLQAINKQVEELGWGNEEENEL